MQTLLHLQNASRLRTGYLSASCIVTCDTSWIFYFLFLVRYFP